VVVQAVQDLLHLLQAHQSLMRAVAAVQDLKAQMVQADQEEGARAAEGMEQLILGQAAAQQVVWADQALGFLLYQLSFTPEL
jgi:hypothetical protein